MEPESRGEPYGSARQRAYALTLLTAAYAFYLLDRNAVLVTQELFKKEFGLSDTQLGLITGTLYGLSYTLAGLPLGWLVDRVNRKRLIAVLVGIWSGLTALCGFAGSFWHLALARVGVGAAESGGAPTALSMLSNIYSAERRGTVSSIFFAGTGIGSIVSLASGGYIAATFGWRAVFMTFGIPSFLLALVIWFTLREPERGATPAKESHDGFLNGLAFLIRQPVLWRLYLGSSLYALSMTAVGSWMISFLVRTHHIDLTLGGLIGALSIGVCGLIGGVIAGIAADAWRRRHPAGTLLTSATGGLINMACGMAAVAADNFSVAVFFLCGWGLTSLASPGPANAAISQLAPPGRRGLAFSIFFVLSTLIGSGLGPLTVGFVSDIAANTFGIEQSLRPALIAVLALQILTAAAFLSAARIWKRESAREPIQAAPVLAG